jgi:L-ascorbate metabolism protein UlaG (beta-lactamase superfamily)
MDNKVYYLGHSAWCVETAAHYLLFDVQDENVKQGGELADGKVNLSKLTGKDAVLLFSHFHTDHYSKRLHKESVDSGIGRTLLGDFTARAGLSANTVTMKPHEEKAFGDVTVRTAASSDAGVCWLVSADGVNIFFAGDHADWADGDPNNAIYFREIDYIAGFKLPIDMAFIPVCTFSGTRPEALTKGAIYAVEKLNPAVTYPMHGNGREELYEEFAMDLKAAGCNAKVICVKR